MRANRPPATPPVRPRDPPRHRQARPRPHHRQPGPRHPPTPRRVGRAQRRRRVRPGRHAPVRVHIRREIAKGGRAAGVFLRTSTGPPGTRSSRSFRRRSETASFWLLARRLAVGVGGSHVPACSVFFPREAEYSPCHSSQGFESGCSSGRGAVRAGMGVPEMREVRADGCVGPHPDLPSRPIATGAIASSSIAFRCRLVHDSGDGGVGSARVSGSCNARLDCEGISLNVFHKAGHRVWKMGAVWKQAAAAAGYPGGCSTTTGGRPSGT